MQRFLLILTLLCVATHSGPTGAVTVFRCVGEDGVIKFQDTACKGNESGRKIELPEPSRASTANPSASPVPQPDSKALVPTQPPSRARAVVKPGASAILCRREDGSRYLSESGRGEQRAVPLGMLGVPQNSLAGAYAGSDGIGVSAPGLRKPPTDRSVYGQLGTAYVWVEDPCARINGAQLCQFFGERIDDAERRLRYAFSDTSDQVRRELESLRQRARDCPR
ncbi:MAG TPA: DUF4124 domain-containing protein [Dokdonella sp.]|uniref:DUF4124 domain-containing protein n=1 Tax=Dokdonella sp. TaxID=2291710 RepID=UPI002D7E245E|nr:DUF4124 domain-containing protein [Dokdonella sp.]HET9031652.1 DUF4124 domain-containing protein [Dokdonella sp.]